MATTIERPAPVGDTHEPGRRADKRNRNLKIALAIVAIIAVGLGIALVAISSGDDSDVPAEVQAALDEFERATEEEDAEALEALVTDDYFYTLDYYRPGEAEPEYSRAGSVDAATRTFVTTQEFLIQRIGAPVVEGEGPWFVTVEENFSNKFTLFEGVGAYQLVEEDGVVKIASYDWSGVITPLQPEWGG